MKVSEQLKSLQAERAAKLAQLEAIQKKAADENRNKDAAEAEEFKTLSAEIDAIDEEIADARKLEKLQLKGAQRLVVDDDEVDADDPAGKTGKSVDGGDGVTGKRIHVVGRPPLAKGLMFARFVKCLGAAKGDRADALGLAKTYYPDTPQIAEVIKAGIVGARAESILKTAVGAGTTIDPGTWASPLLAYNTFTADFIEFLRPQTILGKFGTGNIPDVKHVPFNIHIKGQTSGGAGYWVGQGKPKPVTKFDFSDIYLEWAKVASIAVLSEELLRFSAPSAETLVRDALAGALIERLDIDFIDPAKAEVAHISPASITHGATSVPPSGTDADAVRADIASAMGNFISNNISPTSMVWIMSATQALSLSLLRNAFGQKEFPDITMNGGTFEGVPVITSEYAAMVGGSAGGIVVLVNAQDIWLSDDGTVTVDASREASLQMDTAPTNDSATPTPTTVVSMFQTDSVALRAERFINWKLRRPSAVVVLEGVAWA